MRNIQLSKLPRHQPLHIALSHQLHVLPHPLRTFRVAPQPLLLGRAIDIVHVHVDEEAVLLVVEGGVEDLVDADDADDGAVGHFGVAVDYSGRVRGGCC